MNMNVLLKIWANNVGSSKKEFIQSVFGRHDHIRDGWRSITIKTTKGEYKITLERHPGISMIYTDNYRYEIDLIECDNLCVEFDGLKKTIDQNTEIEIINELLE